jgi:hypothetical protein
MLDVGAPSVWRRRVPRRREPRGRGGRDIAVSGWTDLHRVQSGWDPGKRHLFRAR